MNPTYQKTKIIATIGPACSSTEMLEKLIFSGVDIFRINMSHGNKEEREDVVKKIHQINEKHGLHIGIMADLQGPKIRLGEIDNGSVQIDTGKSLIFTPNDVLGNADRVHISYPDFAKDVKPGDKVLIDDGKLQCKIISTNKKDEAIAEVIFGGIISSRKGVNLPDTEISLPSLTEKDIENLLFILKLEIQWVALSFVRSANDIKILRNLILQNNQVCEPKIIAKIEKPEAIKDLDDIISETDAIMVARGDLGVELPMQEVPLIQKTIIKKCIKAAKPVIVATQMMESMITSITPTRAEVNDVATAVLEGADAVMLSAETSVGAHPDKVVQMMQNIITQIEQYEGIYGKGNLPEHKDHDRFISDSICCSACSLARHVHAKAIIGITHTGYTAFKLASYRPQANIFIFTNNKSILSTLNLVWGVRGLYYEKFDSTDETIIEIRKRLIKLGHVKKGDLIVHVASIPVLEKGKTNMIKLSEV